MKGHPSSCKVVIRKGKLYKSGELYVVRAYSLSGKGFAVIRDSDEYTRSLRMSKIIMNGLLSKWPTAAIVAVYEVKLVGDLYDTILSLIINDGTFHKRYRTVLRAVTIRDETPQGASAAYRACHESWPQPLLAEARRIARRYALVEDVGFIGLTTSTRSGERTVTSIMRKEEPSNNDAPPDDDG